MAQTLDNQRWPRLLVPPSHKAAVCAAKYFRGSSRGSFYYIKLGGIAPSKDWRAMLTDGQQGPAAGDQIGKGFASAEALVGGCERLRQVSVTLLPSFFVQPELRRSWSG